MNEKCKKAKIVLGFDNDRAGEKNTEKALECLKDLKVEILKPCCKDFNEDLVAYLLFNIEKINPESVSKTLSNLQQELEIFNKGEAYIYPHLKEQEYNKMIVNGLKLEFAINKLQSFLSEDLQNSLVKTLDLFSQKLENLNLTQQKQHQFKKVAFILWG